MLRKEDFLMIQALASRGVTNGRDPIASRSRGGRASDPVRAGEGRGRRTIRSNASGAGAGRPEPASPGHRQREVRSRTPATPWKSSAATACVRRFRKSA